MHSTVLLNACINYQLIHQTVDSLTRTAACCSCCLVRPRARRHGLPPVRYGALISWPPCLQARVPAATTLSPSLPGPTTTCLRSRRVLHVRVPCTHAGDRASCRSRIADEPYRCTCGLWGKNPSGRRPRGTGAGGRPAWLEPSVRSVSGRDRSTMRRSGEQRSNGAVPTAWDMSTTREAPRGPRVRDHDACVRALMQRRVSPLRSVDAARGRALTTLSPDRAACARGDSAAAAQWAMGHGQRPVGKGGSTASRRQRAAPWKTNAPAGSQVSLLRAPPGSTHGKVVDRPAGSPPEMCVHTSPRCHIRIGICVNRDLGVSITLTTAKMHDMKGSTMLHRSISVVVTLTTVTNCTHVRPSDLMPCIHESDPPAHGHARVRAIYIQAGNGVRRRRRHGAARTMLIRHTAHAGHVPFGRPSTEQAASRGAAVESGVVSCRRTAR